MKIYLISQDENSEYDTYDSAVVYAESEDEARGMHPSDGDEWRVGGTWCSSPDKVTVQYLGEAADGMAQGIILASFNAG